MTKRFVFWMLCLSLAILFLSTAQAKSIKGAEIDTHQSYQYGRYEIRMRAASASGVISSFFTYKNNSFESGVFWEEIDIEVLGKNNAMQWQSNVILGNPHVGVEVVHPVTMSLADDYHTYVLEWTPDYVAWFLDGVEVRRIIGTSIVTSLANPQSVRFNLWASTSEIWAGTFDAAQLPVYQFINYVEYQSYNLTTKQFEAGWRDDFDSFDAGRWLKANWTFDDNRADFVPENAVVKDGVMVLALTAENVTGFSGSVPLDASSASSASSSLASSLSSSRASSLVSSSASSSLSTSSLASSASSSATPVVSAPSSGGGSVGVVELVSFLLLLGLMNLQSSSRYSFK